MPQLLPLSESSKSLTGLSLTRFALRNSIELNGAEASETVGRPNGEEVFASFPALLPEGELMAMESTMAER